MLSVNSCQNTALCQFSHGWLEGAFLSREVVYAETELEFCSELAAGVPAGGRARHWQSVSCAEDLTSKGCTHRLGAAAFRDWRSRAGPGDSGAPACLGLCRRPLTGVTFFCLPPMPGHVPSPRGVRDDHADRGDHREPFLPSQRCSPEPLPGGGAGEAASGGDGDYFNACDQLAGNPRPGL